MKIKIWNYFFDTNDKIPNENLIQVVQEIVQQI